MSVISPEKQRANAAIIDTLINLGYMDKKDDILKRSLSEQEMLPERDFLFDTINGLDIDNKDLLFLGTISSYPSFTSLLRKLRSLEVLKLSENKATSPRRSLKNHTDTNGDSSHVSITSRPNSKDFVVFNFVSNHLDRGDLRVLAVEALDTLREHGFLIMRESLHGISSEDELTGKFYHNDPSVTCTLMNTLTSSAGEHGLQLIHALTPDPERTCGKVEMTWLFQKVGAETPAKKLQEFLDGQQYSQKGILKYEKIFGDRYVSTGGERTTSDFCALLHLQKGQKVLDVGCGIGGSAFYMAKEYGVNVHGMDLSSNMISIAVERRRAGGFHGVDFEIANVLTRDYSANSFDLAYSRDVILHIPDKKKLFQDIFKWLKPGGKIFVTDYCCGVKEHSADFKDYVKQRGYILLTVPDYGKLLEEVGFTQVRAEDRTQQFISILYNELRKFEPQREEFVEEFSQADYDEIVDGWNAKIKRCHAGDQAWGLFIAEKKA